MKSLICLFSAGEEGLAYLQDASKDGVHTPAFGCSYSSSNPGNVEIVVLSNDGSNTPQHAYDCYRFDYISQCDYTDFVSSSNDASVIIVDVDENKNLTASSHPQFR